MLMLENADDEVKFESWKVLTSVFFLLLYYRFIFDLTLDNLECVNEKKWLTLNQFYTKFAPADYSILNIR